MAGINERDRRALLILAVAVAAFLVLQMDFFAPGAGGGTSASSAELDALEQRLQLAQVQARQRPLTEAELNAAEQRLERLEGRLLESADPALAQAEMRSLVGDLLDDEGIPLSSSRFGAVTMEQERYAQVPLVVEFTCGIEQLVNFMAEVANADRLLATRDVNLQPADADVKSIRVRMTVAGYLPAERAPELAERARGASR